MVLPDGTKSKAPTTKGFLALSTALSLVLKVSGSVKSWREKRTFVGYS